MTPIVQLNTARNLLCTALDHYLTTCISVNKSHTNGNLCEDLLPELMDYVSDELKLVHDLGKTLLKAKAVLSSTRNRAPCIVPISRLPDDVLIQIFWLITAEKSCNVHNDGKSVHNPLGYPTLLTHVCSRWRRVANASKALWSHIDFPSYLSCDEITIARTREYVGRAGNCHLDIHLVEPEIDTHSPPTAASLGPLSEVLLPISSQIRSLDFRLGKPLRSLQCPESGAKRYSPVLSTFFKNSTAGSLKRLAISLENTLPGFTSQHYFIEANENPESAQDAFQTPSGNIASISITHQELEDLLSPVTTLDLKGIYPSWVSRAYHGLVELRLGAYNGISVPEADLRAILSSSPGLRHLELGIKITRSSSTSPNDPPAFLDELETLVTGQRNLEELGSFLRLICPGKRPLSISLDKSGRCSSHPDIPRVPFSENIQAFFSRANVGRLSISGTFNYPQVVELLGLVPRVRTLALSGLCLGNIKSTACTEFPSSGPLLEDIYLLRGVKIAQHFLVWLAQTHHVRRLVVSEDSKVTQGDVDSPSGVDDKRLLADEASLLGCTFEYISSGQLESWNSGL